MQFEAYGKFVHLSNVLRVKTWSHDADGCTESYPERKIKFAQSRCRREPVLSVEYRGLCQSNPIIGESLQSLPGYQS